MQYGLIGEHLTHSYSCEIHSIIADYEYELCELRPDELEPFMKARQFRAINVTIPYKQSVIPFLDEISETAKRIGAVNTVVNRGGRLFGYNTDFYGMRALAERIGIKAAGKKLLILGTGGTSRTAYAVAESLGAGEIIKVSRSARRGGVTYEDATEKHADADIIFNTTPAGLYPAVDAQPISLAPFGQLEAVLDVIYNPLRTNLVLEAQGRGIAAEGGLFMLSGQAAAASALFRDTETDPADTEKAFTAVRDMKRSIVLTGMPSSGKTSVGRVLAEKTGKEFADTDEIIVSRIGMPIADFFAIHGEEKFRELESGIIAELASTGGKVIATGGGAVLRSENVRALKRDGVVVFIDRAPEKLIATSDRPLSSDREALMRRYTERYGIYTSAADVRVDGNGSIEETAELIYRETLK